MVVRDVEFWLFFWDRGQYSCSHSDDILTSTSKCSTAEISWKYKKRKREKTLPLRIIHSIWNYFKASVIHAYTWSSPQSGLQRAHLQWRHHIGPSVRYAARLILLVKSMLWIIQTPDVCSFKPDIFSSSREKKTTALYIYLIFCRLSVVLCFHKSWNNKPKNVVFTNSYEVAATKQRIRTLKKNNSVMQGKIRK